MVKTQVQIPDRLYREAKRIAAEYEMSFAEVVRRAIERIIPMYPQRSPEDGDWTLPRVDLGGIKVPLDHLKDLSAEDETNRGVREDRG